MNNNFYVYCHTNKMNNKKYIGITSQKRPQDRWRSDGSGYNGQIFGKAIKKYGWNNFHHEIIYKNLSFENACKKEKELIKFYNTTDKKYGYNISAGGDNVTLGLYNLESMSTKVYMYSIAGDFLAEFPSMMEAERITGIENSAICACCKGRHAYTKDYRWSYEKVEKLLPINKEQFRFDKILKNQVKQVFQYDSNGNFIKSYASLSDASRKTGVDFRNISQCCHGKTRHSAGYMWFYNYKGTKIKPLEKYKKRGIPVRQYDLDMNFIAEYKSQKEAYEKTGIDYKQISYACTSKTHISHGYIWLVA